MSVTYAAGTNTITIDGEGTAGSPYNIFTSLYASDQAAGWNKMIKYSDYQYHLKAKIIITGDSYVVGDTYHLLIDCLAVTEAEFIIRVEDGYMRLGYSNDEDNFDARGGVDLVYLNDINQKTYILWNDTTNGQLDLFACHIRNKTGNLGIIYCSNGKLWSNKLESTYFVNDGIGANVSRHNNTIQVAYRGYSTFNAATVGERDKILNITYWPITPTTLSDGQHWQKLYARDYESLVNIQDLFSGTDAKTIYVGKGFDVDNWEVNFRYWVTGNPKVIREHTFDLTVVDSSGSPISGATVILYNTDNTVVFSTTTDSNGQITQQTVQRSYCQKTWTDGAYAEDIKMNLESNATKDYAPFRLKVSKAGYDTRQLHGITLAGDVDYQMELTTATDFIANSSGASVASGKSGGRSFSNFKTGGRRK